MHLETILKEFAPLANGPGGVQKLRELVLNLSISGRLSDRCPDDGHAAALVESASIAIEKAIKSGKIRKPKYFENIAADKLGAPLPANWVYSKLGDLGLIAPRNEASDEAVAGFVPMAAIEAKFGLPHSFEERQWADIKNGYTHVANGDVVLAKITPCFENGKSATIAQLPNGIGAGTTELHVFRQLAHVVEPGYALAFLKSESFIQAGIPKMTGTAGQKRIPAEYFALSPFPLPPLAEQKRIVAKVNELMVLCDALESQQAEEAELKRAAAVSALHYLTEAKTSGEAADHWSLLATSFSELFDDLKTIKALREAIISLCVDGKISPPSVTWSNTTIGKICERMDSGWSPKCEDGPALSDKWGALKTTSVQRLRFMPEENKALPSNLDPRPEITVRRDDILITRAGPTNRVGIACVVTKDEPKLMLSDKIIRFTVDEKKALPAFVVLALTAGNAASQLESAKSGMAASQVNISQNKLRAIEISYPPLAEQQHIVAKVDELMMLCDTMEEQIRESESLNAELMASLVHILTETDPDGGGGAAETARFAEDTPTYSAPNVASDDASEKSGPIKERAVRVLEPAKSLLAGLSNVDTKFKEAVLVGAIVKAFYAMSDPNISQPIGNFRLQKAVYFARRHNGEHVGQMDYLKKAAGPYNPSMKYSGGIAIAKQKNWLREARGRFGFGHVPGPAVGEVDEWIDKYGYGDPARWVAEHFRFKKNDDWEILATVDYAMEHLQSLGIEADAGQILQYIRADDEWWPKIEKLGLTEMSIATAMIEVKALFGGEDSV